MGAITAPNPAYRHTYKMVAVYGTAAAPAQEFTAPTLDLSTGDDPDSGVHGVYFDRGLAASQAYATKFGAKPTDSEDGVSTDWGRLTHRLTDNHCLARDPSSFPAGAALARDPARRT